MAIMKDGSNEVSIKEIRKSIEELFEEGRYHDMFQKAGIKNKNSKDKKKALYEFYNLIDENVIENMVEEKTIDDFINALNQFLDSHSFTYNEKVAFFNECEEKCIIEALNANQIELARKINNYRKDKNIGSFDEYLSLQAEQENIKIIEEIMSMSTCVTGNDSEVIRILLDTNLQDYDFFSKLISQYKFDINDVGVTYNKSVDTSFSHMVLTSDGTSCKQFFSDFLKEFANKINFDVSSPNPDKPNQNLNFFEQLFNCSLVSVEKLDRLHNILENCDISVKHIAYISNLLIDDSEYYANYYDHKVYELLFSYKNFNVDVFDREAILLKIIKNDTSKAITKARKNSGYTINPTSIMLQKFFNCAKPAISKNEHPFITWVKNANEEFSKDTLITLINYYGDDLLNLDFRNINTSHKIKTVLEELGFTYPKSPGWRVIWGRDNEAKKMRLIRIGKQINKEEDTFEPKEIKTFINNSFAVNLLEQVKDEEIKKLVESVNFNYQQYQSLDNNRPLNDDVHYMTELLPKFLKTTIDNYLHYSMLDSDYAKQEALVQLKLLNRKAFSILKAELDREESDIKYQSAIHSTVIRKYD